MHRYLFVLGLVSCLHAMPILSGDGLNEWNNRTVANIIITPHSVWAAGEGNWISAWDTGLGGIILPNATEYATASFYESITLGPGAYTGSVTVWCDDTCGLYWNDALIVAPNFVQGDPCAQGSIGCEEGEGYTLLLDSIAIEGVNTLRFDMYQRNGDVAGVRYFGSVDLAQSTAPVPEPVTWMMLPFALACIAVRKWTTTSRS